MHELPCGRLVGQIDPEVVHAASRVTRNELINSLLTESAQLQAEDYFADFLIVDQSYSVGDYDEPDQVRASTTFDRTQAKNPNVIPTRKNFSSRVYFVLAELIQQGYLYYAHPVWDRELRPAFVIRLTPTGVALVANPTELQKLFPVPKDNLCFVIMSFSGDKRLGDFYRFGIKAAIEEAGYECVRVDEIEHNRKITDLLLQRIEASRFLVADLTEARPNCYYELGWAHRASKDVILTIHSSTPIHFDIKDYNFLVYESASDLHDRLYKRIQETIGIHQG